MWYLVVINVIIFRVASVSAGRHAEPPGQQCGRNQIHGDGGGRVRELPHGH